MPAKWWTFVIASAFIWVGGYFETSTGPDATVMAHVFYAMGLVFAICYAQEDSKPA